MDKNDTLLNKQLKETYVIFIKSGFSEEGGVHFENEGGIFRELSLVEMNLRELLLIPEVCPGRLSLRMPVMHQSEHPLSPILVG